MSLWRKPATKKIGLKVLVVGETGTGKTTFGLSAPKSAALDSEAGISLYEDQPEGKNLVLVANTQSFTELEEAMDDVLDNADDLGVETVIIDSETKFYNDISQAVLTVEERKAVAKGRDPLDSNLSIRSFGKIGQISEKLQNFKIDLSGNGINVISIAQQGDIKKFDKKAGTYEVVGHKPNMKKDASYDYDIVIYLSAEGEGDDARYFGTIEKDRTKTFKRGHVIDNPTFDLWNKRIKKMSKAEKLGTDFKSGSEKSQEVYKEQSDKEDKTIEERLKDIAKDLAQNDKPKYEELKADMKAAGIKKLSSLTAKQLEAAKEIVEKFE